MPDIEVTDEMIEAGEAEAHKEWIELPPGFERTALAALYRAMRAKERAKPIDSMSGDDMGVTIRFTDGSATFHASPQHDIPIPDA